jgi:hypothetical protein
MPLPTKANLLSLQYAYKGGVYCNICAKASIIPGNLEYAYKDSIWYGIMAAPITGVKTVMGVNCADIKTIMGVDIANIKTIQGVS